MVSVSLLNQAKYLLLLEATLIAIFVLAEPMTFIVVLALVMGMFIFYYSFQSPFFLQNLLIFSILVGSLGLFKVGGKTPPILLLDLFFVLAIFIFILRLIIDDKKDGRFSILSLLWIPFLIWGLISPIIAYDKFRALLIWRSYFAGFISFSFAYYIIQKKSHINALLVALISWGLTLAIIEFYILIDLGGLSSGIIGIFLKKNLLATSWGKSNYLATFFVLIIPITIGYFITQKSYKNKIFSGLALVFMFSALIFTLSRGGILALLLSITILLFGVVKGRTMIPITIGSTIIALIVALNPLTTVIIDRLATVERSYSYMMRLNFYKDVWKMAIENPIIGVGLGNLGYNSQFKVTSHASAHNIILGLTGETGFVGAFLFLMLIGKVFLKYLKQFKNETVEQIKILRWSFISSFVGCVIHSLMEPNFEGYQFSIMFWLVVALYFKLYLFSAPEKTIIQPIN